jgi:hypothetical protein
LSNSRGGGGDARTTYEHIGQFLAQVSDAGITDVHRVKLFPLSLSSTAFNWFTSLAPNSMSTWASLEERFHEYFYNGETELKLSNLTAVRQNYAEMVTEYIKRFRETRNKCYSLTIREKDLADLALAGLSTYLREKLEGTDFVDVNQVMQRAIIHENHARDNRSHGRFKEGGRDKEKGVIGAVDENASSDDDVEVCVAEWVDTPKNKPKACAFLKPGTGKRDEMRFTFDVLKCDKLFDILLQNNVIRLKGGHVIPTADQLARRKYCKWHNSFSHMTNECNYFLRQIQSALNDGRLTLGDGHQMKLDVDPFPVDMIDFVEKKVLVRQDQAGTTRGKNVLVSDEFRLKMLKPKNPEVGVWKENARRKDRPRWKPTSSFLIKKYMAQRRGSVHSRLGGRKRERSPCYDPGRKAWTERQYQGQQEPVRR